MVDIDQAGLVLLKRDKQRHSVVIISLGQAQGRLKKEHAARGTTKPNLAAAFNEVPMSTTDSERLDEFCDLCLPEGTDDFSSPHGYFWSSGLPEALTASRLKAGLKWPQFL